MYDIYIVEENASKLREKLPENLFERLNKFNKIREGDNEYAPIDMHEVGDYILGTLAQTYYSKITKFSDEVDNKNEEIINDGNINDKTYFYIDKIAKQIVIQGKLYPSVTLSKGITLDRVNKILSLCLEKVVVLLPAKIEYTIDEIEEIFKSSFIKRISFKNLEGLELPLDSKLHNPRKDLDESLIETWNVYSKDNVDTMEFKAKGGRELKKNPFAKIGMELAKNNRTISIFKNMDVYDDGERVTITQLGNDNKIIDISKKIQEDPYETYDKILIKIDKQYNGRF